MTRSPPSIPRLALVACVLATLSATPAFADDPPFTIGARSIWYLTGGVTTGGTVALDDRGAFVGGELSLTRLRERHYLGFYGDAYYDWGVNGTYLTAGPEVGTLRRGLYPLGFGVDGGVAVRFADGSDVGATGRLFITLGAGFAIYGRYSHFGTGDNEQVVQLGLSLKVPVYNSF